MYYIIASARACKFTLDRRVGMQGVCSLPDQGRLPHLRRRRRAAGRSQRRVGDRAAGVLACLPLQVHSRQGHLEGEALFPGRWLCSRGHRDLRRPVRGDARRQGRPRRIRRVQQGGGDWGRPVRHPLESLESLRPDSRRRSLFLY